MKKLIGFLTAAAMLAVSVPVSAEELTGDLTMPETKIEIDEINFPDPAFRNYISQKVDYIETDGYLSESEIMHHATHFNLYNLGISSLEGIQCFPYLEVLHAQVNNLTEVDLSNNPELKDVCLNSNQLTSINVKYNLELVELEITNMDIPSIDISRNSKLEVLVCDDTLITELDVSNNPELTYLSCGGLGLETLDLSNNPKMEELHCDENNLTELDVTGCPELRYVDLYGNQLTEFDVSKCPKLEVLGLRENLLTEIDVSANTELENIDLLYNQINSLDVSMCPKLEYLYVSRNNLPYVDVTKNPLLKRLDVTQMALTEIDVTQNPLLESLDVGGEMTSLDLSKNPKLTRLNCTGLPITELDLSANPLLEELYIDSTDLSAIDLSKNTLLETLWCRGVPLQYLDLEKLTNLYSFYGPNTGVAETKVTGNTFDLADCLTEDVDFSRITGIENGSLDGTVVTVSNPRTSVIYYYDTKNETAGDIKCYVLLNGVTLTKDNLTSVESVVYTGEEQKPEITMMCGETVIDPRLYTVEFSDNVNAGTAEMTITAARGEYLNTVYSGSFTATFEILKAEPEYTIPTNISGTQHSTLGSVKLPAGFSWEEPETVLSETGELSATVTYTPADTQNYETVTGIEVLLTVGSPLKGDVNLDGKVDISDATLVLSYYANTGAGNSFAFSEDESVNEIMLSSADVDGDGNVTISDATAILTYYARTGAGIEVSWEDIIG